MCFQARRAVIAAIWLVLLGGACATRGTGIQTVSTHGADRSPGGFSGLDPPPDHRKWPETVKLSPKISRKNLSKTELELTNFSVDSVVATLDPPNCLRLSYSEAEESVATQKRQEVDSTQVASNQADRRRLLLGRFESRIANGPLAAWDSHDEDLKSSRNALIQLSGGLDRVTVSRFDSDDPTIVGFYADAWTASALVNADRTIDEPPKLRQSTYYYELTVKTTGPSQFIVSDMDIEMTESSAFDNPDDRPMDPMDSTPDAGPRPTRAPRASLPAGQMPTTSSVAPAANKTATMGPNTSARP